MRYSNGHTTIKAEKINGEWHAPKGCAFPTKEIMVAFLTATGWEEVKDAEETKSFSPYRNDGLTESQRLFKIRSNMSFTNRG